jgi:RHS repeat-associated protein
MKYRLTFALVASLTSTAFAAFQAPLPEFKNEKQLAEWRAEKASGPTSQGYVAKESAFYTGKPYLASTGGYAFKYRSYSPELARWTSEDPSGFPDGANGNIYAPSPTMELDYQGLSKTVIDWKLHEVDITNDYTLSQQKLDVGMDPTNPLFMTDAAYQTFQNTINITYPIGTDVTVGPSTQTKTKIVEDGTQFLRIDKEIFSISFSRSCYDLTTYRFHALIISGAQYVYTYE